ncbi:ribonuclease H-like domain-containing protein [Leptodontidium sp. MPI-SDFR-AT-0119]|nr:ribonuclease H-like domain-containing protein [Leptodontidium sp. MPI-SDFR-AT-0119]
MFCYNTGEDYGLSPSRRFLPSEVYDPPFFPTEIEISSKPPNFTHVACGHASPCHHCGRLQPHVNSLVIAVGGTCRGNGQENARSAIGVYFSMNSRHNRGRVLPANVKTNQAAELYAGLEALRMADSVRMMMDEQMEGLEQVVIKSDSVYLVKGMTEWALKWERDGWKTAKGQPVVNEELFKQLLDQYKALADSGVEVLFWHVRRDFNTEADRLANDALDGN